MKAITAYLEGVRLVIWQKKLWFFFYAVLLFFGLIIMLPVHGMILEHLGYPLDIGRDLGVFDYTQIADLLNNHGEALGIIFYQAKWILFFYVLITVLTTSGLVHHFNDGNKVFSFSKFISKGLNSFWKIFRLTFYFLLMQLLLLGFCLYIYQIIIGSFSPFEIEDDSKLVSGFWMIAPFYLFFAFSLQIVSDIAKYKIVGSNQRLINSSILHAFKTYLNNFGSFLFYFFVHVVVFVLISQMYLLVKSLFVVENTFGFWLLILLGQLYIFLKVGLRLIKYAGLNELCTEIWRKLED